MAFEKLKELKEKSKKYYKTIGKIHCPYFDEEIYFTNSGFHHLFYKGGRKKVLRQGSELKLRLKLLHLAPKLISITTTLQEFEERKNKTKFWGFIAILGGVKVKVIVCQVPGGKKHFLSIFPNWITRRKSDK